MHKTYYVLLGVCLLLCGCASVSNDTQQRIAQALSPQYDSVYHLADKAPERIEIRYAKGLKVSYQSDGVHVFISDPNSTIKGGSQELVIPASTKGGASRFICTTALQLGNFEILGLESRIVGINSLKNIFSANILSQLSNGSTQRVGKEGNFDLEAVIAAKPDYIFVSASKYGGFEALKDCGIPLVQHHGYKETDPLGQAEWIKLVGLLTGETKRANAVFDYIEKEYLSLKRKVAALTNSSSQGVGGSILSGRQLRDGWYVMGGKSYMAQLFRDAGVRYVMDDLPNTGGTTLDFETVYARGINADFWQTDGSFDEVFTLEDLRTEDARYADIKAFKEGKVLFCNLTKTPYRELAGVEPHIMLADFVKAFHPTLLPNYKPKYYDFLK